MFRTSGIPKRLSLYINRDQSRKVYSFSYEVQACDWLQIGAILARCYEFAKMLKSWQKALHYAPREAATESWVVLRDPAGKGLTHRCSACRKNVPARGADFTSTFIQMTPMAR